GPCPPVGFFAASAMRSPPAIRAMVCCFGVTFQAAYGPCAFSISSEPSLLTDYHTKIGFQLGHKKGAKDLAGAQLQVQKFVGEDCLGFVVAGRQDRQAYSRVESLGPIIAGADRICRRF